MRSEERLPNDVSRCVGVSTDEGELVYPCVTCRRLLWAKPAGERTPWFTQPPRKNGVCEYHFPIPQQATRSERERQERLNARRESED